MVDTASTRRRILVPVLLVAVGGLVIWFASVWARDDLEVHRVTPASPGAPALILLHGYGAPGHDLVGLGDDLSKSLPGVQILAPEGPFNLIGSGRAWYVESPGEAVESRGLLAAVVDQLISEGTPAGQIVVAGFSQGATMAADIAIFHEGVGCVAVLSGRPLSGVGWNARLARGSVPDVFVAHGRKDRTVAFSDGRALAEGLEEAGAVVTFVEFPGGHEIPDDVEDRLGEFVSHCLE